MQAQRVRLTLGKTEATIEYVPPEPEWLWGTLHALQRLSRLRSDWDSFGGEPISDNAVLSALFILGGMLADHASLPIIVPTSAGGVQLEWHRAGVDAEIEIAPNGRVVEAYLADSQRGRNWVTQTPGLVERQQFAEAITAL